MKFFMGSSNSTSNSPRANASTSTSTTNPPPRGFIAVPPAASYNLVPSHLIYPLRYTFDESLILIGLYRKPRSPHLETLVFPTSAQSFILSGNRIDNHAPDCACERCLHKYQFPTDSAFARDFEVVKHLSAGPSSATAVLKVMRDATMGAKYGVTRAIVSRWGGGRLVYAGDHVIAKRRPTHTQELMDRFRREIKVLQFLKVSPFVVQMIISKEPTDAEPWGHIFMTHDIEGDCHTMMQKYYHDREHLPELFMIRLVSDIGSALRWLHSGQREANQQESEEWIPWIHNNIQPENILMRSPAPSQAPVPRFILCGLGDASRSSPASTAGCRPFWSPERISKLGALPTVPKDDIFSLGVTLFVLANFTFPFPKTKMAKNMFKQRYMDIDYSFRQPYRNPYSRWLNNLICGLISLHPDDRLNHKGIGKYIDEAIKKYGIPSSGSRKAMFPVTWWTKEAVENCLEISVGGCLGGDTTFEFAAPGSRGSFFDNVDVRQAHMAPLISPAEQEPVTNYDARGETQTEKQNWVDDEGEQAIIQPGL